MAKTYVLQPAKNLPAGREERKQKLDQYKQWIEEAGGSIGNRRVNDFYFDYEVNDKEILLCGLGKHVRGNMNYILDVLNTSPDFEGYTIYIRTKEATEEAVKAFIAEHGWKRSVTLGDDKTTIYDQELEKAKYLLTEVYFSASWIRRNEQVYINIWHGTPLKKLGLSKNFKSGHKNGNTQVNFIDADYLLYPNDYTKVNMLSSYKIEHLSKAKRVMLGYPRTGGLLYHQQHQEEAVRKKLAPANEKLYAFMPTWKEYVELDAMVEQTKRFLTVMDEGLEEDAILYVNLHHKVSDILDYSVYKHIRKFPGDMDSYQLLAYTDALITDYSSVFFDYLATKKQIILYCPDYKEYKKRRGTYLNLMSLPFDKSKTPEGVLRAIRKGKTYHDEAAVKRFCAYDSPENAKKLCGLFLGKEEGVTIEEAPKEHVPNLLLFDQTCGKGPQLELLKKFFKGFGIRGREIYIACERVLADENRKYAYPMLFGKNAIGVEGAIHMSALGRAALDLCKDDKLSFEQTMEIVSYDYRAHSKRIFGRAVFDRILLYEIITMDMLLTLLYTEGQKILYVTDVMIEKMEEDPMFVKAAAYAMPYMSGVFAASEKAASAFEKLCGQRPAEVIDQPGKLKALLRS
ncbi:MAG: CDP-glycerol glycerophosphotransferase family protein [Lachnospiraceae bacterium]|nr:CDP-glycerol glycerophosphotransferase family protein [Lachnospiraceae bacterium]